MVIVFRTPDGREPNVRLEEREKALARQEAGHRECLRRIGAERARKVNREAAAKARLRDAITQKPQKR